MAGIVAPTGRLNEPAPANAFGDAAPAHVVLALGGLAITTPAGKLSVSDPVSVSVTSALAGTYLNTIPVGALVTSAGNNLAPAIATLTVLGGVIVPPIPPAAAAVGVPTFSTWALLLTIMLLTIAAATVLQTRHKPQTSSAKPNR